MRRVLIGTPSYDGRIDVWFANSLVQTVKMAEKKGIFVHAIYTSYDSLVQRARNSLIKLAIDGGYDDLFFIDSDTDDLLENEDSQNNKKYDDAIINLAYQESLLDYASELAYTDVDLQIHYRSRHPLLINFSNAAFYGKKLNPLLFMRYMQSPTCIEEIH
jgi:hypothetical protein